MRILTIVLAALMAILPDCLGCFLCGVNGGGCVPSATACAGGCPEDGCGPPAGAASEGDPCTCGEDCRARDDAPAPVDAPPAIPAVSASSIPALGSAAPAAVPPATTLRGAGPPTRLPLRI